MQMVDHGDVGSAFWASVLALLGAIVGPFFAFVVIRSIRRGGIDAHRT
jgi:hypothetical protein